METTELMRVLMERDGMTKQEAFDAIEDARLRVLDDHEDPTEVMMDAFGLEPDYIMDLLYF